MRVLFAIMIIAGAGFESPVFAQELTASQIKAFALEAQTLRAECAAGKDGKPCSRLRFLHDAVEVGKTAIEQGNDLKLSHQQMRAQEALSGGKLFTAIHPDPTCRYGEVKREKYARFGILESGGGEFKKFPDSRGGACFHNGRGGSEPTVSLCDNPLSLNIQTLSGPASRPITHQEDYYFDAVKGKPCNLVEVTVREIDGKKVLFEDRALFPECLDYYKRHLSKLKGGFVEIRGPASVTEKGIDEEARRLAFCLQYQVLPPPAHFKSAIPAPPK